MEPWYNMNRIEQIIGRAVRRAVTSGPVCETKRRNISPLSPSTSRVETADMYLYRKAEAKAVKLGG